MSKSKILFSLIVLVLAIALVGNVISLATEPTQITSSSNSTPITTTQIGASNTSGNTNTNTNTNTNAIGNVNISTSIVSATNTNTNKNTNTNSNTNVNTNSNTNSNTNTNKSSSNYATNKTGKLPYAGTSSSSIIILGIAFALSAVYAYKKVKDYNI